MNFIRRIGRDEMYIKYVHQLVNVSTVEFSQIGNEVNSIIDPPPISKLC
jgi:hypothetical protein